VSPGTGKQIARTQGHAGLLCANRKRTVPLRKLLIRNKQSSWCCRVTEAEEPDLVEAECGFGAGTKEAK